GRIRFLFQLLQQVLDRQHKCFSRYCSSRSKHSFQPSCSPSYDWLDVKGPFRNVISVCPPRSVNVYVQSISLSGPSSSQMSVKTSRSGGTISRFTPCCG